MHVPTLAVVTLDQQADEARVLCEAILSEWPDRPPPRIKVIPVAELAEASIPSCDVALLLLNDDWRTNEARLGFVTDHLDEIDIPLLVLEDATEGSRHRRFVGEVYCQPASRPVGEIRDRLRILLRRQKIIGRLRMEISVAKRFQGGLRGEIVKMHEELQLAAMVQREYLPRTLPCLHDVGFAAMWRPANYVSGDIYDVSRLDEDHIGVFLADAVGHGVPAALMTMVIARSLRMKEVTGNTYRIVPPSEALALLNTEMIRCQGENARFATAAYAVINCRTRCVTIAGAGHPPPFHLRADGSMHPIETTGGLLGVFPDEQYEEIQFDLAAEESILLYSDGFEVAFREEDEDDRDLRLPTKKYIEEFGRLHSFGTPEKMIEEVGQRLNLQPGSLHQADDLTLVCMKAGVLRGARGEQSVPSKARSST